MDFLKQRTFKMTSKLSVTENYHSNFWHLSKKVDLSIFQHLNISSHTVVKASTNIKAQFAHHKRPPLPFEYHHQIILILMSCWLDLCTCTQARRPLSGLHFPSVRCSGAGRMWKLIPKTRYAIGNRLGLEKYWHFMFARMCTTAAYACTCLPLDLVFWAPANQLPPTRQIYIQTLYKL